MSMETFTYIPSYPARKAIQPRVLRAVFGDGYEQRAGDGINTAPAQWSLTFDIRNQTDADGIDDFLTLRGGYEAFNWSTPEGDSVVVVCDQWSKERVGPITYRIEATFRQVFEG